MKKRFLSLLLLAPLVATAGCERDGPRGNAIGEGPVGDPASASALPPRGTAWVIFDADTVTAEVADTPAARQRGLQHRDHLDPGTGMLFVFPEEETQSFWMRDTFIPLDIAFLDRRQEVVDIQQMEPETEELHESARPAMFALEVPQGWFQGQEIDVGDRARIVFGPR